MTYGSSTPQAAEGEEGIARRLQVQPEGRDQAVMQNTYY